MAHRKWQALSRRSNLDACKEVQNLNIRATGTDSELQLEGHRVLPTSLSIIDKLDSDSEKAQFT
jgi:hypothetical protein